jgi:nucleoside-diphosphate-sugar epimerase
MKKIIINGANGYVASNFIQTLLKQNYKVIALVRAGNQSSPNERMMNALSEIDDGEYQDTKNLKVYNYALGEKNFSMSEEQLDEIFSGDVDYFHFAASLKFDLKSREEIFKTNVDALDNSINIFSKHTDKSSRFFFIGTAYSCGKTQSLFEEKFYPDEDISNFRNYYEQSKRYAENVIKKHIDQNGLNGHIVRLSQVVGNNKTGITKTDYGIFDFVKRIHSLSYKYPDRTLRVHIDPNSTQDLIAIDTVVDYFMQTIEKEDLPVIMNFVANTSVENKHIANSLNKLLPTNLVLLKDIHRKEMDPLEKAISVGMAFTGSYIDTKIQFDTKERDNILITGQNEANAHTVYKMLKYFIKALSDRKQSQEMAKAV